MDARELWVQEKVNDEDMELIKVPGDEHRGSYDEASGPGED